MGGCGVGWEVLDMFESRDGRTLGGARRTIVYHKNETGGGTRYVYL
jgi:hypothetical protein